MKYYFTYGTDGQPFVGGWTEVEAPTVNLACAAVPRCPPRQGARHSELRSAYTEESFLGSCMAGPDGTSVSSAMSVSASRSSHVTRMSRVDFENLKGEST